MKYQVDFIDSTSRGQVKTTYITGDFDEDYVIDFFGLEDPDVEWYEITVVDD